MLNRENNLHQLKSALRALVKETKIENIVLGNGEKVYIQLSEFLQIVVSNAKFLLFAFLTRALRALVSHDPNTNYDYNQHKQLYDAILKATN